MAAVMNEKTTVPLFPSGGAQCVCGWGGGGSSVGALVLNDWQINSATDKVGIWWWDNFAYFSIKNMLWVFITCDSLHNNLDPKYTGLVTKVQVLYLLEICRLGWVFINLYDEV